MIFSNKFYKIENGNNPSLDINKDDIFVYLFNKTLNLYQFSRFSNPFCTFINNNNAQKVIKLNHKYTCLFRNDNITIYKDSNDSF